MSLYTRLTKRDLPAEGSTLAIASVFAELTRYQRGTRTESQVRNSLGLSSDEWADALVLVAKIDGVYDANRLADDLQRVIALLEYNRDLTGQGVRHKLLARVIGRGRRLDSHWGLRAVMADVKTAVVRQALPSSTGNFTVSIPGATWTPKAVLVFVSNADSGDRAHAVLSIGMCDGSNERAVHVDSRDNLSTSDTARSIHEDLFSIYTNREYHPFRGDSGWYWAGSRVRPMGV